MICPNCAENQVEYSNKIAAFAEEIAFIQESHQLTTARKSNLMRDWLTDQGIKHSLRCQLRRAGLVPLV
ncbi:hypothetical protein LCGC14_2910010 [marine sediment metagenome]|uniref:Uncharacterized protein n=1 Tax=marine sediment metagenome TaxID=412755 RepID=A0A0F8XRW8_9ZZZZ